MNTFEFFFFFFIIRIPFFAKKKICKEKKKVVTIILKLCFRHITQDFMLKHKHQHRFFFHNPRKKRINTLSNQLDDTTGFLDLLLGIPGEVAGAHNDGDLRETALSENLGVTEREEVDDGSGVGLLAGDVGFTLFLRDKSPELFCQHFFSLQIFSPRPLWVQSFWGSLKNAYLVEVDGGLPELLVGLVEISHSDLTEVTGMVLVQVGAVVVLTTGHTATTGVLAVLANTTVTGLHMTAAVDVSICS